MGKLNESMVISNLENNDYISVILADGTLGRIKKTDLAEAMRSEMAVATNDRNGLIDKIHFSVNGAFSTEMISYADDIDNLHTILGNGISTVACTIASKNRPYSDDLGGIIINVNRIAGFSVRTTYQLYISASAGYKPKARYAGGRDTNFVFSKWE